MDGTATQSIVQCTAFTTNCPGY